MIQIGLIPRGLLSCYSVNACHGLLVYAVKRCKNRSTLPESRGANGEWSNGDWSNGEWSNAETCVRDGMAVPGIDALTRSRPNRNAACGADSRSGRTLSLVGL
jgi:hypothetical protein